MKLRNIIIVTISIIVVGTFSTFFLNASASDHLSYTRIIKKGSSGSDVKKLQNKLLNMGFYLGSHGADGSYGNYTKYAVKGVQSARGIKVDGIVGKKTIKAINYLDDLPSGSNTAHFKQSSFKCKCCSSLPSKGIKMSLLFRLEALRAKCGNKKVYITSGYRCPTHNTAVGGGKKSQHLYGKAADIKVSGLSPSTVAKNAESIFGNGGLGRYNSFTHVDIRGYKSRW